MRQQEKTSRPNQDNRRPQGDRPARNGQNGGYNNRANGDRPARQQGDRPYRNNNGEGGYNNRNNGDRPARQGDNRSETKRQETKRPFNNGDRDRDSIRETAAADAIITSAEEIMVED